MEPYRNVKVAVLGATGFIGSHLTERLVELGAEVMAVSKTPQRLGNLARVSGRIRFATADLTGPDAAGLFQDFRPKKVFHLASLPDGAETFQHMRESLRQNTEMVINVLELAAAAKVETVVFGDSSKVYGNGGIPYGDATPAAPVCSYAIAKSAAWSFCQLYSTLHPESHVVSLRPTMVYGPGQSVNLIGYLIAGMRREGQKSLAVQGGWQTRDPLYIDDAVEAFARAGVSVPARGNAIPIGGGVEMTVAEICERVKTALGSEVTFDFGSEPVRATEIFRSHCDNKDARRLLDWQPRVSFQEGLARLAGVAFPERALAAGAGSGQATDRAL
jgi:nucleoside-diphosphate-sugar epimerase